MLMFKFRTSQPAQSTMHNTHEAQHEMRVNDEDVGIALKIQ